MRRDLQTLARRVEAWFFDALVPCGADFAELGGHATFEALGVEASELSTLLLTLERDLGVALAGTEVSRACTVGEAIERVLAHAA